MLNCNSYRIKNFVTATGVWVISIPILITVQLEFVSEKNQEFLGETRFVPFSSVVNVHLLSIKIERSQDYIHNYYKLYTTPKIMLL